MGLHVHMYTMIGFESDDVIQTNKAHVDVRPPQFL